MAIAHVQNTSVETAGAVSSQALAFPGDVTAGNVILVAIVGTAGSAPTYTVTDDLSNTYTLADSATNGTLSVAVYYAPGIIGGTCTVTVTPNANATMAIGILEYSGADPNSPITSTANATASATSVTVTAGTVLTGSTAFGVAGASGITGGTVSGPGGSWTERFIQNPLIAGSPIEGSDLDGTDGSESPQWTSVGSSTWGAVVVVLGPPRPKKSIFDHSPVSSVTAPDSVPRRFIAAILDDTIPSSARRHAVFDAPPQIEFHFYQRQQPYATLPAADILRPLPRAPRQPAQQQPQPDYQQQRQSTLAAELFRPTQNFIHSQPQQPFHRQDDWAFWSEAVTPQRKFNFPPSPISVIQRVSRIGFATGAGSFTLSLTGTQGGSQIVVALALQGAGAVGSLVVTDTHSNAWTLDGSVTNGNATRVLLYRATNLSSGNVTITFANTGNTPGLPEFLIFGAEVLGLEVAAPDKLGTRAFTSSTAPATTSVTTNYADEYALAIFTQDTVGSDAITQPGGPWATRVTNNAFASGMPGSVVDRIDVAVATMQATWGLATAASGLAMIATYRARQTDAPIPGPTASVIQRWEPDHYRVQLGQWDEASYRVRAKWPIPVGSTPPTPPAPPSRRPADFQAAHWQVLPAERFWGYYLPRRIDLPGLLYVSPGIAHPTRDLVIPPVPRDPQAANQRLRRFMDIVSDMLNAMVAGGQIVQTGVKDWRVYGSAAFVRSRAPTVLDDSLVGYHSGAIWIDSSTQAVYVCITNGANSASWVQFAQGDGVTGTFS